MSLKKFFVNNKQITIINDSIVYLDFDKVVDGKNIISSLKFVNDKIAYLDVYYSFDDFDITKFVFCKTRLHVYLCNILIKLKNTNLTPEEIYEKLEKVVDNVIT